MTKLNASELKSRYITGALLNFTVNQKLTAFFSGKSHTERQKNHLTITLCFFKSSSTHLIFVHIFQKFFFLLWSECKSNSFFLTFFTAPSSSLSTVPALSCPDELSFKALMHPLCTSSPKRLRSVSDLSTSSASLATASNL